MPEDDWKVEQKLAWLDDSIRRAEEAQKERT